MKQGPISLMGAWQAGCKPDLLAAIRSGYPGQRAGCVCRRTLAAAASVWKNQPLHLAARRCTNNPDTAGDGDAAAIMAAASDQPLPNRADAKRGY